MIYGIDMGKEYSCTWIIPIQQELVTRDDVTEADIRAGWEAPHLPNAARSLGVDDSEGRTLFVRLKLDVENAIELKGVKFTEHRL